MANTIAKRTFPHFDNVTIELFRRTDGTHRIKYVGHQGHELVINLCTSTPAPFPEDEFEWLLKDIQTEWDKNRAQYDEYSRHTANTHEFHWIIVKHFLIRMANTIQGGARHFAKQEAVIRGCLAPIE